MAFLGGLFGSSPPDPGTVANQQALYNQMAATGQQKTNMIGQSGPLGSFNYVADPSSPSGYRLVQTLSTPEQNILGLQQQGQIGAGTAAGDIGSQLAGLYGTPAALDPTAMTNQMMDWQTKSIQPYWDIQKSNLESQLANQGLNPNDPAWQNAMMAFTKGIGQAQNQFFAQAEPLAFQQAIARRELPMTEFQSLLGMTTPQFPTMQQTPTAQIQPANYTDAAYRSWADQQQRNQAAWSDIAKLAGAVGGSIFSGGMPGGAGGGQFAGGWGGGNPLNTPLTNSNMVWF